MNTFILASSILFTWLPFLYIGRANLKTHALTFENVALVLPVVYGALFSLVFWLIQPKTLESMFLLGAVFGLTLSLIGRFGFNMPKRLFQFDNPNWVHPIAVVMYGSYFALLFWLMPELFL